jgi:hypothetical protein
MVKKMGGGERENVEDQKKKSKAIPVTGRGGL